MSILFEPIKIGGIELKNRFARAATNDGGADENGRVQERQVALYGELARGGVGLIIAGATNVRENGQILRFQKRITTDDHIPGLKSLCDQAHQFGAAIAVQLFHGGAEAGTFAGSLGLKAGGPSYLENDPYFPFFKAPYETMSEDDIHDVILAFGQGARRAREAGFDAIQLHGAHGYLFSQFMSPHINRRQDDWGGDMERRLRLHKEVYLEIRRQAGEDFPITIKVGVQDSFPGGLEFEEGHRAMKYLAELGFDAIEISSGARGSGWKETEFRPGIKRQEQEAYYRLWSREIKPDINKPVLLAGGLRSFELMEDVVRSGDADIVAMSRPLIREPHLIRNWEQGGRQKSACISCNQCVEALLVGRMALCGQLKETD